MIARSSRREFPFGMMRTSHLSDFARANQSARQGCASASPQNEAPQSARRVRGVPRKCEARLRGHPTRKKWLSNVRARFLAQIPSHSPAEGRAPSTTMEPLLDADDLHDDNDEGLGEDDALVDFDEDDDDPEEEELYVTRPGPPNETWPGARHLCLHNNDVFSHEQLKRWQAMTEEAIINAYNANALVPEELLELWRYLRDAIFEYEYVAESLMPPRKPRGTFVPGLTSIDSAWETMNQDVDAWRNAFIFEVEEVRTIVDVVFAEFPDDIPLGGKLGRISKEEAVLVFLARQRTSTSSWVATHRLFGRSKAKLCRAYRITSSWFVETHKHLVDPANLGRFAHFVPVWRAAMDRKLRSAYNGDLDADLPAAWHDLGGLVDAVRLQICKPKHWAAEEATYNAHGGYACNFIYVSVLAPCGLYVAVCWANGRHHDVWAMGQANLNQHLGNIQLRIYGDNGCPNQAWIRGLPADNELQAQLFTPELRTALASVRTSVENSFHVLRDDSKIVNNRIKNKLFWTNPGVTFLASLLLYNVRACLRGNVISRTFNLPPPSIEEYFAIQ